MSETTPCRSEHPELFFPEGSPKSWAYQEDYGYAREVCESCPVRASCLEENLDVPYGVWGGLDRYDRGRLLVARGQATGEGRPVYRSMSPFPNDNLILGQRKRREAEIAGDRQRIADADRRMRARAEARLQRGVA